jgi:DNA-binding phage protein
MTKQIREYIKEHGRTAARMKFGTAIDDKPIYLDGRRIGILHRYKHEQYGCWVWSATIKVNDQEYSFIDFDSQTKCLDWAYKKIDALKRPQFGIMLREAIASSPMTVDAIAKVANCSRYVIFKWMRSESWPPVHTLKRIAAAISPMGYAPMFDVWCDQIELEQ